MLSMPRIVRPNPHRIRGRNSVPPLDRPLVDPLSETKNWRNLLTGRRGSQVSHSLPKHTDLAELYRVPTKSLNLAVKRNADRFLEDFTFQLTDGEARSRWPTHSPLRVY
jgi:hypothetical protein